MPTIERKAKFSRTKSIIKKTRKRTIKEKDADFDYRSNVYIDRCKKSKLSDKVIENLIKKQTVVEINIESEYDHYSTYLKGIIVSFNDKYLILFKYVITYSLDEISVCIINRNKILRIEKIIFFTQNVIKHNFNIHFKDYNYFNSENNILSNLPIDVKVHILDYVNLINYYDYLKYDISSNIELYNKLKNDDLFINFIIDDYFYEIYGKIIDVQEKGFYIKEINEGFQILSSNSYFEYDKVKLLTINLYSTKKEKIFNKYSNLDLHNNVIKKINKDCKFENKHNVDYENIQNIITPENVYNLDETMNDIINFLALNPVYIDDIVNNYSYNKNIIKNIQNNFDINLIKKPYELTDQNIDMLIKEQSLIRIDYANEYQELVILYRGSNYIIGSTIIDEDTSSYGLDLFMTDKIKKVTKIYKMIDIKNINQLNDSEVNSFSKILDNIKNGICWITTTKKGIDCMFKILDYDDKFITAKVIYKQGCLSPNKIKIKINTIARLCIENDYDKFYKFTYDKFKNTDLTRNYQLLLNQIYYDLPKQNVNLMDDWFISYFSVDGFYEYVHIEIAWNNGEKCNNMLSYRLQSYFKIKEDTFENDCE